MENIIIDNTNDRDENISIVSNNDKRIEELTEQLNQLKLSTQYIVADFENYKKRSIKEKIESNTNITISIFKTLLPFIDDYERIIINEDVSEGVKLVYDKFCTILNNNNIKVIDVLGKELNTEMMEAISVIDSINQKGVVVDVLEKGYTLNDKVLRYAKVIVGK